MKWQDLTSTEKKRLFEHMDIPTLFPSLENRQKIQKLWNEFITIVNSLLVSIQQSPDKYSLIRRPNNGLSVYQCKDVTP